MAMRVVNFADWFMHTVEEGDGRFGSEAGLRDVTRVLVDHNNLMGKVAQDWTGQLLGVKGDGVTGGCGRRSEGWRTTGGRFVGATFEAMNARTHYATHECDVGWGQGCVGVFARGEFVTELRIRVVGLSIVKFDGGEDTFVLGRADASEAGNLRTGEGDGGGACWGRGPHGNGLLRRKLYVRG